MNNEYDICIALMQLYGLRPAEVLSLRYERIIAGTMIFAGAKGSRDRFVRNEEILGALQRVCGTKEEGKVFTITRHMLYKECVRRGIVMRGRKRRRVTVAPRHLFIARLKDAGLPVSEIQEQVGHKRRETTEYYINQR
jgi:integrase